jgi:glycosyltransferase involved in cell wall biosynthesis
MYKEKSVSVVIPAYNEEKLIAKAISNVPEFVEKIIVVNDASKDKTLEIVQQIKKTNIKVQLIDHEQNQGVGGAIASGYKWSRDNEIDIAVVMAGDAQMHPDDLPRLLDAIVEQGADFAKGNRMLTPDVKKSMPKLRFFASQVLSLLTKIASGYWHTIDPQCGYTAINKKALQRIDWDQMYKRYGQPNDLLVRLNVANAVAKDVEIKPIYNIGEKSGINYGKLIFSLSWLLFKDFVWRIKEKYIRRDFHPLVFFYALGGIFFILTIGLSIRLFYMWWLTGEIPPINALAAMFTFVSMALFTLFAMWFDMDYNKDLK